MIKSIGGGYGFGSTDEYTLSVRKTDCKMLSSSPTIFLGGEDSEEYFQYVPSTSGWYTFDTSVNGYMRIYDQSFTWLESDSTTEDVGLSTYLISGDTYYITFGATDGSSGSISCNPATFTKITPESSQTVRLGNGATNYLVFIPDVTAQYTVTADMPENTENIHNVIICSETGNLLADTWHKSPETSVSTTYSFTAGQTYYLGIDGYAGDGANHAIVSVTPASGGEVDPPPAATHSQILALYPTDGADDVGYSEVDRPGFQITFDRAILSMRADNGARFPDLDFSKGTLKIFRASDDRLIYQVEHDEWMNTIYDELAGTTSGDTDVRGNDTLVIDPISANAPLTANTEYYITLDEGFVQFEDGTVNPAIEKGDWTFKTQPYKPTLYGSDFQMGVDSFSFNNNSTYFGKSYVICDEYYNALLQKLTIGEKLWIRLKKWATMSDDFSGSCFGESAVMSLMYLQELAPSAFHANANAAFDLDYPKNNDTVASLINYYHLLQHLSPFDKEDKGASQQAMGNELIETLLSDNGPVIVNLDNYDGGKHCVVAYAVDADSDADDYLVYIADSNALLCLEDNSLPAAPTTMYVNKTDYSITRYVWGTNGLGPGDVEFLSVISDFSVFSRYNIQKALELDPYSSSSSSELSVLTTSYPQFTIEASGKQTIVTNDSVLGDLTVIGPFAGSLHGKNGEDLYTYYVEAADSYSISSMGSEISQYTTSILFYNNLSCSYIESQSSTEITVQADGSISQDNASGSSTISTTITPKNVDIPWYFLTLETANENISITNKDGISNVNSTGPLGSVQVIGSNDWCDFGIDLYTADRNVSIYTDIEKNVPYLCVANQEKEVLGKTSITYSVSYISNGGTFVDTMYNIPYGSAISEPIAPEKEGYVFEGWYQDSNCSGENWDFSTNIVTEDLTLYAKWSSDFSVAPPDTPNESVEPSRPSGGSSDDSYPVSTVGTDHGDFDVSPTRAEEGEEVTITVTPDEGYEVDEVIVTDRDGDAVDVTDEGDGVYTFEMPDSRVTVEVTFAPVAEEPETPAAPTDWANPYADVAANAWYYDAVAYVTANGLMTGTSATTFAPNVTTTRAMIWTVLARMNGQSVDGGTPWYTLAQSWVVTANVSDGTNPTNPISREELATMLYRAAGSPAVSGNLLSYPDGSSVAAWAESAMLWATQNGIISGIDGMLTPQGQATRAQVATMLMRFCEAI